MTEHLDIYESCRHLRKTNRPDVLDDLLEIEFVHLPTRRLLKRARFFVTADGPTAKWIRKHPTFSRGCWPLGLMNLHQWIWKVKFIEVDGHSEIEGGTFDPKVGKTLIRAEFDDFEGKGWLVPLVKLANTHILDQLRQFYNDAPAAFPSPDRITNVMGEEMRKIAAKHQANALEQTKRRAWIQAPATKVRIFIDESGDIGFRDVYDLYVFAPVVVPDARYAKVVSDLRGLLAKHWRDTAPAEIHMTKVPEGKRKQVQNDLAQIIIDNDIRVMCFAMKKWLFIKHLFRCHAEARFAEEMPLNLTWHDLVTDKDYFLQSNVLATAVEEGVSGVAIDFRVNGITADFYHDRKHCIWMNDALELGFTRGIDTARKHAQSFFGLSIVPTVSFAVADSESEPCLWLSDWIANELRGWAHHQPLSPGFQKARQNMRFVGFDNHGVKHTSRDIGGHGDEELPDLPREIVRGNPHTPPS